MTTDSIGVDRTLVEGLFGDPAKLLAVLKALSEAAMAAEVTAHVGAGRHERSQTRSGHRNGYKPRKLSTRVGMVELSVPQVRGCEPYSPSLFGKWQRSERALFAACAEMYFQGVSTRNVSAVLEAMCDGDVSAMTVSRVASELDEKLSGFRTRRLDEHEYPYVKVDARYEKVRDGSRVVSRAVLVTMGYTESGHREILDHRLADSESESSWGGVFAELKGRGLKGVRVLASDAHAGIRSATARHLQGVVWQRCQVHFKREIGNQVSYKKRKELMKDVCHAFEGADDRECLRRSQEVAAKWEPHGKRVSSMLLEGFADCLGVMSLPADHRKRMTSTNELENLMRRLRKRTRVVCVFPTAASCERLIGSQLMEVHEEWLGEDAARFNMHLLGPTPA